MKLFDNKEKFIQRELKNLRNKLEVNLDKLPNEELPFMEPHLRALYFQVYFLTAYGFNNPALTMCGVLLEALIKQRIFDSGVPDEKIERMYFGGAIEECSKKEIISNEEVNFLKNNKNKLRNNYIHYNQFKLTKGIQAPGWRAPGHEVVQKLIELDRKVKKGLLTEKEARIELVKGMEPRIISSKDARAVAQTFKSEIDERIAIPTFLKIDKFVREFAKKYFSIKNN